MPEKYSIVFYPPPEWIAFVAAFKQELHDHIGWYNSVNSEAHVTIGEFHGGDRELDRVRSFLLDFVAGLSSTEVRFNSFGCYSGGAFFLSPNEHSVIFMKKIMKTCIKQIPVPLNVSSVNPHMSIARKLDSGKLEQAFAVFNLRTINVRFMCDRISIRKFNGKQFDIVEHFYFKGEAGASTEVLQLSLF